VDESILGINADAAVTESGYQLGLFGHVLRCKASGARHISRCAEAMLAVSRAAYRLVMGAAAKPARNHEGDAHAVAKFLKAKDQFRQDWGAMTAAVFALARKLVSAKISG